MIQFAVIVAVFVTLSTVAVLVASTLAGIRDRHRSG